MGKHTYARIGLKYNFHGVEEGAHLILEQPLDTSINGKLYGQIHEESYEKFPIDVTNLYVCQFYFNFFLMKLIFISNA